MHDRLHHRAAALHHVAEVFAAAVGRAAMGGQLFQIMAGAEGRSVGGEHKGAQLANEPGAFSWNELNARDVDGSIAFYTSVFGWTYEKHEMEGPIGSYTEWQLDGQTIGGMLPMPPMVPAEVPQFWLVYFAVEDLDASLAKVQELGGMVTMPGMTVDAGRFAVIMDPQGAALAIIQLAQ